jgi:hypothetical protein
MGSYFSGVSLDCRQSAVSLFEPGRHRGFVGWFYSSGGDMTIHRYLNKYGKGGNHTTWWLVKAMLNAGWTVPASGSGTGGLYATSNVFDTAQTPKQNSLKDPNNVGVGSEPWGHAYCWLVLEDPSGNRQIILQRDSSNTDNGDDEWYVGYSPGGRFGEGQVAGTDWDADTMAAAPDEYALWGSRTGWTALFEVGGAATMVHVAADDTPSPAGEYGVFLVDFKPENTPSAFFFLDDLRDAPTAHPHPLVMFVSSIDSALTVGNIGGTATPRYAYTIQDFGGGGEARISLLALHMRYSTSVYYPGNAGQNLDGKSRLPRVIWGFVGTEYYLGLSRWLAWVGEDSTYPKTADAKTRILVNQMLVSDLWDGVTVPAVV